MKVVATLALVGILAAGCGGSGTPHFQSASGWHVGSTQHDGWASTVSFRDCPSCVPPHRTIAALPPGGIVIQLQSFSERQSRTVGSWPPRIRARDVKPGFEGVPPRYGFWERQLSNGRVVRTVFVWFGRAHPTPRQLANANAELGRFSP